MLVFLYITYIFCKEVKILGELGKDQNIQQVDKQIIVEKTPIQKNKNELLEKFFPYDPNIFQISYSLDALNNTNDFIELEDIYEKLGEKKDFRDNTITEIQKNYHLNGTNFIGCLPIRKAHQLSVMETIPFDSKIISQILFKDKIYIITSKHLMYEVLLQQNVPSLNSDHLLYDDRDEVVDEKGYYQFFQTSNFKGHQLPKVDYKEDTSKFTYNSSKTLAGFKVNRVIDLRTVFPNEDESLKMGSDNNTLFIAGKNKACSFQGDEIKIIESYQQIINAPIEEIQCYIDICFVSASRKGVIVYKVDNDNLKYIQTIDTAIFGQKKKIDIKMVRMYQEFGLLYILCNKNGIFQFRWDFTNDQLTEEQSLIEIQHASKLDVKKNTLIVVIEQPMQKHIALELFIIRQTKFEASSYYINQKFKNIPYDIVDVKMFDKFVILTTTMNQLIYPHSIHQSFISDHPYYKKTEFIQNTNHFLEFEKSDIKVAQRNQTIISIGDQSISSVRFLSFSPYIRCNFNEDISFKLVTKFNSSYCQDFLKESETVSIIKQGTKTTSIIDPTHQKSNIFYQCEVQITNFIEYTTPIIQGKNLMQWQIIISSILLAIFGVCMTTLIVILCLNCKYKRLQEQYLQLDNMIVQQEIPASERGMTGANNIQSDNNIAGTEQKIVDKNIKIYQESNENKDEGEIEIESKNEDIQIE